MRSVTPPVEVPGRGRRITAQRACNGCGRLIGDVTMEEVTAAINAAPLPDVREECGCVPRALPGYVYVASSWRNPVQPTVVAALGAAGIPHYDFRNPEGGTGFSWAEVKPDSTPGVPGKGSDWEAAQDYLQMVNHPRSVAGFRSDFDAMQRADTFVMVLPCGKSAHLELGWAVGAGKRTVILLEDPVEPELMYRMVDHLATSVEDLLAWLGAMNVLGIRDDEPTRTDQP